jgi:hypothetical protein
VSGDPYAVLVELAERERDLVDAGSVEQLAPLAAERAALVAALPDQAPPAALPALERAAALQRATSAALEAAMAETRRRLGAVDRGRDAVRAYGRAA